MKKLIAFVLLILSLSVLTWGCGTHDTSHDDASIHWIPEESGFVDFEVSGDYVKFRYRICFVNETREDIGIKLTATFDPDELAGWIEYKDFYDGLNDQGKWDYQTVNASGKTELVFTFQGKYLGGSINNSLSFPQELIIATAATNDRTLLSMPTDGSIQLSNGETYGYFLHESPSNVDFNGLIVETATLEQLLNRLDTSDIPSPITARSLQTKLPLIAAQTL